MPSDDDHTLLRRSGDQAAQTSNNPQFALLSSKASVRGHRRSKPAAAGVLTRVYSPVWCSMTLAAMSVSKPGPTSCATSRKRRRRPGSSGGVAASPARASIALRNSATKVDELPGAGQPEQY